MKPDTGLCAQQSQDALEASHDAWWSDLYLLLQSLSRRLVFSSGVPGWRGQEDEVAEDLAQETAYHLLAYRQKIARGEAAPISSLERFVSVVARNRCRDSVRRDRRLVRLTAEHAYLATRALQEEYTSPFDVAIEHVDEEACFVSIARLVVRFPEKQRRALLIDLANRMCFEEEATALQRAFLNVGIRLQDYQRPLPTTPRERARHCSLLYYAYRRFALFGCLEYHQQPHTWSKHS